MHVSLLDDIEALGNPSLLQMRRLAGLYEEAAIRIRASWFDIDAVEREKLVLIAHKADSREVLLPRWGWQAVTSSLFTVIVDWLERRSSANRYANAYAAFLLSVSEREQIGADLWSELIHRDPEFCLRYERSRSSEDLPTEEHWDLHAFK